MLKAAVIGVGSIGQNHARVYREMDGAQLVAVVDANAASAARIGGRLNVPHYSDIDKMLDEQKPDLVSISVPTSLHFKVGMDMIARGLHVLVEKPITSTLEQAQELCDAAKKKGVLLAVGHIERFNPAVMELRRRLREGRNRYRQTDHHQLRLRRHRRNSLTRTDAGRCPQPRAL